MAAKVLKLNLTGILAVLLSCSFLSAQDIDPRGIYFNRFVGQFNGTEWFQAVSYTHLRAHETGRSRMPSSA